VVLKDKVKQVIGGLAVGAHFEYWGCARFNVAIRLFAHLTGRSLTSFKRDFEKTFHDTPSHWLVQKRLQEAYFLMDKKGHKASDVYIEVGFEDLSHFSFAFKKKFGFVPTQLTDRKKNISKET
jgi:AraC family transcriptional regulator, exoenzyme S synthesis regulatory protein ExsA